MKRPCLGLRCRFLRLCDVRLASSVSSMSKKSMTVAEAGRKGGHARAQRLTREDRVRIAKLGYHASSLSDKHKQCQHVESSENKNK